MECIRAVPEDAVEIVRIYDRAFVSDFLRDGVRPPAYGKTVPQVAREIAAEGKMLICRDGRIVGTVAFLPRGAQGEYYVSGFAVLPEEQGSGLGTEAFRQMLALYPDWTRLTLTSPVCKTRNTRFYEEKCGFHIARTIPDEQVPLYVFEKTRDE